MSAPGAPKPVRERRDAGMSFVELIIAMGISALLLGIIAAIFGQGLGAQQQAGARNAVTARTVSQTTLFTEVTRDATAVWVSAGRDEVRARTQDGTAATCHAWRVSPAGATSGSLGYRKWTAGATMPAWKTLDEHALLTFAQAVPGTDAVTVTPRSTTSPKLRLTIYSDASRKAETATVSDISLRPLKLVEDKGGACW